MAPFCIVDILIPFPCLPQPLPPKINVEFWTLKSFFYFRQHFEFWTLKSFFTSDNNVEFWTLKSVFLLQTTMLNFGPSSLFFTSDNNVEFWTLKSFFYFRQTTLIRGVGGFTAFKRNEIINELNVC